MCLSPFVAFCFAFNELCCWTYVVAFCPPKQTNATIPHLHLTSNGSAINIVDSAEYLGVVLDNELHFKQHIKIMEGKAARCIGILSNIKHFFPQNIMLQVYYALVHPILSYDIIIWGATYPKYTYPEIEIVAESSNMSGRQMSLQRSSKIILQSI